MDSLSSISAVLILNPFHWLKLRCWRGCHPTEDSRGTFPAPEVTCVLCLPPALASLPLPFHHPASFSSSLVVTSLTFSTFTVTWLSLTRTILPRSCKDPCGYTGHTDNLGQAPHLQTLSPHRRKSVSVGLLLLLLSLCLVTFLNQVWKVCVPCTVKTPFLAISWWLIREFLLCFQPIIFPPFA